MTQLSNLKINGQRLWQSLMDTAQIGATPEGGVKRLTLGAEDGRIRTWLVEEAQSLGLQMVVDEAGNMFATLPGQDPDLPAIAMGSHLDTQPTGGKFDGILGVLAALEVVRSLKDANFTPQAPLMVVNWTNEEGSRFSPAMLGSGIWAGVYPAHEADTRLDQDEISFGQALDAIGWRGAAKAGSQTFGAMFELHIEQGPVLEAEGKDIGIVTGVQGLRWFEVRLQGRAAHTGSTPMHLRQNALLGAARLITAVEAIGRKYPPHAVATVGFIEVAPNSNNVIAGEAFFSIDMRHPEDAVLAQMEEDLRIAFAQTLKETDLSGDLKRISKVDAVHFDRHCIEAVRQGVERTGLSAREIISGAGHDAVHTAAKVPTTMIFVPSKDGLSHNPGEYTSPEQCAAGAQVLCEAVLNYDRYLFEQKGAD